MTDDKVIGQQQQRETDEFNQTIMNNRLSELRFFV